MVSRAVMTKQALPMWKLNPIKSLCKLITNIFDRSKWKCGVFIMEQFSHIMWMSTNSDQLKFQAVRKGRSGCWNFIKVAIGKSIGGDWNHLIIDNSVSVYHILSEQKLKSSRGIKVVVYNRLDKKYWIGRFQVPSSLHDERVRCRGSWVFWPEEGLLPDTNMVWPVLSSPGYDFTRIAWSVKN